MELHRMNNDDHNLMRSLTVPMVQRLGACVKTPPLHEHLHDLLVLSEEVHDDHEAHVPCVIRQQQLTAI